MQNFLLPILLLSLSTYANEPLTLSVPKANLIKDENITLTLKPLHVNPKDIVWIIDPKNSLHVKGLTITPKEDTTITLQAKHKNRLSNKLTLHVKWIVNGHTLPPMPDEKINNSTLLGIDVNENGVRDDVERWIYETYDEYIPCIKESYPVDLPHGKIGKAWKRICEDKPVKYHQIVREIAMQAGRAAQIIIQNPENALETTKLMDAAQDCLGYFSTGWAEDNNETIGLAKTPLEYDNVFLIGKEFDKIQFNTTKRLRAYGQYNFNLSGHFFSTPSTGEERRKACDFNISKLIKAGR